MFVGEVCKISSSAPLTTTSSIATTTFILLPFLQCSIKVRYGLVARICRSHLAESVHCTVPARPGFGKFTQLNSSSTHHSNNSTDSRCRKQPSFFDVGKEWEVVEAWQRRPREICLVDFWLSLGGRSTRESQKQKDCVYSRRHLFNSRCVLPQVLISFACCASKALLVQRLTFSVYICANWCLLSSCIKRSPKMSATLITSSVITTTLVVTVRTVMLLPRISRIRCTCLELHHQERTKHCMT
ncbi:hypothetical protein B0T12DRAFT_258022 [Alternaria alternata]|jgi:hypothetical protein|nr:hypothetical protein B0T12DRAFT_258022 [Alternaria alternata]